MTYTCVMTATCVRCDRILKLVADLIPAEVIEPEIGILDFLETRTVADPASVLSSAVLYDAYRQWCFTTSRHVMSVNKFGRALQKSGFPAYRGTAGRRMRRGLALT